MIDQLGGWLAAGESFRNRQIICYHKNWAYLEERFQVRCADYVESKPGIPPTPGHVAQLIRRMRSENLNVLLAATYFDAGRVETVASRGGASVVHVAVGPRRRPGHRRLLLTRGCLDRGAEPGILQQLNRQRSHPHV